MIAALFYQANDMIRLLCYWKFYYSFPSKLSFMEHKN